MGGRVFMIIEMVKLVAGRPLQENFMQNSPKINVRNY